jgi:hypothetical protein
VQPRYWQHLDDRCTGPLALPLQPVAWDDLHVPRSDYWGGCSSPHNLHSSRRSSPLQGSPWVYLSIPPTGAHPGFGAAVCCPAATAAAAVGTGCLWCATTTAGCPIILEPVAGCLRSAIDGLFLQHDDSLAAPVHDRVYC